jgi:hypothetical protein
VGVARPGGGGCAGPEMDVAFAGKRRSFYVSLLFCCLCATWVGVGWVVMWILGNGEEVEGTSYLRACAFVGTAAACGMPVTMVVRCMLPDGSGLVSFGDCVVFGHAGPLCVF